MATRSTPYTETHPDGRDGDLEASRRDIQIVSNYIREHVPGVEAQPCIVETAMYTVSTEQNIQSTFDTFVIFIIYVISIS